VPQHERRVFISCENLQRGDQRTLADVVLANQHRQTRSRFDDRALVRHKVDQFDPSDHRDARGGENFRVIS
jgi:hypothetical protein